MIRALFESDLNAVVALHIELFPRDLITQLGERYLRRVFYPWYLRHPDGCGLAATEAGRLLGYVVGSVNTRDFYRSMAFQAPGRHVLHAVAAFVRRPWTVGRLLGAALFTIGVTTPPYNAELSYIGVRPEAQGTGIGRDLARRFLEDLRARGAAGCWAKTHVTAGASRFYESLGFTSHRHRLTSGQALYSIRLSGGTAP